MFERLRTSLHPLAKWKWHFVALLGWLLFGAQGIYFAHFQQVSMDEGAYLYSGWLFARGVYHPFQPYGPWTNKMPLAFLFYGYVERLFHPGLDTGRYFAVACGLLALGGMWILARRFTNAKGAALVMWMATVTVALPRIYSLAITESIVMALVIWSLVFVLHERPRAWQLFLGGVLAGILSVTRINLIFVWIFVSLFTWHQYGIRKAIWAWIGEGIIPMIVYTIYWPGILRLWLPWVPKFARRGVLAEPALPTIGYRAISAMSVTWAHYFGAIADPLRTYPLAWLSLISATLLAWMWRKEHRFIQEVLKGLVMLLWALLLLHAWATIGRGGPILFNLSIYTSFFVLLTFIVGGIVWWHVEEWSARWGRYSLIRAAVVTVLISGFGTNTYLLKRGAVLLLVAIGHVASPFLTWLPLEYQPFRNPNTFRGLFVISVMSLVFFPLLGPCFYRLWRSKILQWWRRISRRARWGMLFLVIGVLSPTPFFSGSFHPYDCPKRDTLALHEQLGRDLRRFIPPNAKVYWQGIEAVTPLLYLPYDVKTFPPQYTGTFNYVLGGDAEMLYRLGFWNETLARRWRQEADVIIVSKGFVLNNPEFQQFLSQERFREWFVSAPLEPCKGVISCLVVYKRGPN